MLGPTLTMATSFNLKALTWGQCSYTNPTTSSRHTAYAVFGPDVKLDFATFKRFLCELSSSHVLPHTFHHFCWNLPIMHSASYAPYYLDFVGAKIWQLVVSNFFLMQQSLNFFNSSILKALLQLFWNLPWFNKFKLFMISQCWTLYLSTDFFAFR